MATPLFSFVHFTDTHVGPTADFARFGAASLPCLNRFIDRLSAFPVLPDFVIHTGDVSNDQSPESYELAAEALGRLPVPVYYVNGNHDLPGLMRKYLVAPANPQLPDDLTAPLDYTFEVQGERFLVLDGQNPAVPDPNGLLRPGQLDYVREVVASTSGPLTVLLHYAPFEMGSPWLDEHMILKNGEDLHALLVPARDRIRGVFYGHLHRSSQVSRDGITYTCAGSTFSQFAWRPWDVEPQVDESFPSTYNYVQYFADPNQVIVHQYAFAGC